MIEFLQWAQTKRHIVIYGAGEYAFWLSVYLELQGILWDGYVISQRGEASEFLGRPVRGLTEGQALLGGADGVIVAVSRQYHREIARSLADVDCPKYFVTMALVHRTLDVISDAPLEKVTMIVHRRFLGGEENKDWLKSCVAYYQGRGLYNLYAQLTDRNAVQVLPEFMHLWETYADVDTSQRDHTVEVFGQAWRIADMGSFLAQYEQIFVRRIYEFTEDKNRPLHILDCGANIGMSVKFYLENYPQAQVEAFEADPEIFSLLDDNLAPLTANGRCVLHNQAVWDSAGTLSFTQEGDEGGHIAEASATTKTVQVKTADIADVLAAYEVVDFWKIDIEGAETRVLTRALPYLERVRHLFVEYHSVAGEVQTIDKIFHILVENGFRVFIDSDLIGKNPFLSPAVFNGFDGLVNIYATRR